MADAHTPAQRFGDFPNNAKEVQADAVVVAASAQDVLASFRSSGRRMMQGNRRITAVSGAPVIPDRAAAGYRNPAEPGLRHRCQRIGLRRGFARRGRVQRVHESRGDALGGAPTGQPWTDSSWREFYRTPIPRLRSTHMSPTERGNGSLRRRFWKLSRQRGKAGSHSRREVTSDKPGERVR